VEGEASAWDNNLAHGSAMADGGRFWAPEWSSALGSARGGEENSKLALTTV